MATLNYKGKGFVWNHHLTVKHHELIPRKNKSLTPDRPSLQDNLIVHGDNLKALKALLPSFHGKVKCVYIDPPYNTGNDAGQNRGWVYSDNVNSPMMQEWLNNEVSRDDLTKHDKWLCMMTPRLKVLRELLHDEGVIFVSIDDNEVHHLRTLMDEIFGEENFLAVLTWRGMHTVRNSSKDFNQNTEYVVVYARRKETLIQDGKSGTYLRYPMDKTESYPHDDKDGKGPYKLDPLSARNFYTPYKYKFKNGVVWEAPEGSYPRYSIETLREMEADGEIVFSGKEPKAKRYLQRVQEGVPPDTLLPVELVGFSKDGTSELAEIFKGEKVFNQPKPVTLIKFLLRISRKVDGTDCMVLDASAGSGTTAHAVLALNKEDGGNRRFILIECEDYADKVTAERVRRVIKGVPKAKDEALRKGLGGSFSYFDLGEPIDVERLFDPKRLPSYAELARHVFFTATGVEFDPKALDEKNFFIGETKTHKVYLYYRPNIEYLKTGAALTLDRTRAFGRWKPGQKRRLVFAPSRYVDHDTAAAHGVDYAMLPFEIYRLAE